MCQVEVLTHIGGAVTALRVVDGYAYTGGGSTFAIVDVTDPTQTRHCSSLLTHGRIADIAVAGGYAYVADAGWSPNAGLRIIDVHDPYAPQHVGFFPTPVPASHVALMQHYALVTADMHGLYLVNVHDPVHPVAVGHIAFPSLRQPAFASPLERAWNICVYGPYAYVNSHDLVMVDVSTPTAPQIVGRMALPTDQWFHGVCIVDATLYLVSSESISWFSLADPLQPTLRGQYWGSTIQGAVVGDQVIYLAQSADDLSPATLQILDIRRPAHPHQISVHPTITLGGPMVSRDGLLYTIGQGVQTINVADPTHPHMLSTARLPAFASYALVDGSQLYLAAGWDGIYVLDTSLATPQIRAHFVPSDRYIHQLVVTGTTLYVLESGEEMADPYQPGGLRVLETHPQIRERTFISIDDFPDALEVVGSAIYLCATTYASGPSEFASRLCRWDVDALAATQPPVVLYAHDQRIQGMVVQGSYAYLATRDPLLLILDIRDPTQATVVGSYHADAAGYGLVIRPPYAYIAAYNSFHIVDISNPSAPQPVSISQTRTLISDVALMGDIAWLADPWHGVRAVNIADPRNPVDVATYPITGGCRHVTADDQAGYVSAESNGLFVVQVTPDRT